MRAVLSAHGLDQIEADPWAVDADGQYLMCRAWAARQGSSVGDRLIMSGASSDQRLLWEEAPLGFVTPSRRILDIALKDSAEFLTLCQTRGTVVFFVGWPEPEYTRDRRAVLYRSLSLPTQGAPNTAWPEGLPAPAVP